MKYCLKFITSINIIKQSMKIYQFFISFISASILLLELSTYHIQSLNHSRWLRYDYYQYSSIRVFSIPCRLYKDQGIFLDRKQTPQIEQNSINWLQHMGLEEDLTFYHLFVPGQIYFTHIMVHMYHMI